MKLPAKDREQANGNEQGRDRKRERMKKEQQQQQHEQPKHIRRVVWCVVKPNQL